MAGESSPHGSWQVAVTIPRGPFQGYTVGIPLGPDGKPDDKSLKETEKMANRTHEDWEAIIKEEKRKADESYREWHTISILHAIQDCERPRNAYQEQTKKANL